MTIHALKPCLWFDDNAQAAAAFYTSIFNNSKIGNIAYYGKEGFEIHGRPEGSVMTVEFTINGTDFTALNGGPVFKFNESVSFQVPCETQVEIDTLWEALSEGGEKGPCGWIKDKFGLSWQIVPKIMDELMTDKKRADRVMKTMLTMTKLDIETLKAA